jgi:hypothetical protein
MKKKINGGTATFHRAERGWHWTVHRRLKNPPPLITKEGKIFYCWDSVQSGFGWVPSLNAARSMAHSLLR